MLSIDNDDDDDDNNDDDDDDNKDDDGNAYGDDANNVSLGRPSLI